MIKLLCLFPIIICGVIWYFYGIEAALLYTIWYEIHELRAKRYAKY